MDSAADVAQIAWSVMCDVYRHPRVIEWRPDFIATASIYFALASTNQLDKMKEGWWVQLCDTDIPAMRAYCEALLELYDSEARLPDEEKERLRFGIARRIAPSSTTTEIPVQDSPPSSARASPDPERVAAQEAPAPAPAD